MGCQAKSPALILIAASLAFFSTTAACQEGGPGASSVKFDGMVDVGGYTLHCMTYGEGSPTIVFISGFGAPQTYWGAVAERVAGYTSALSYDRAGYYKSELGPEPPTAARAAAELRTVLAELKLPAPYILVAHSYGGDIGRLFAIKYPAEVAGFVIIDSLAEGFLGELATAIPRDEYEKLINSAPKPPYGPPGGPQEESKVREISREELLNAGDIPDIPVIVLLAGNRGGGGPQLSILSESSREIYTKLHSKYFVKDAAVVSDGEVVTVDSGHNIPVEKPDVVAEYIRKMYEKVAGADK